MSVGIGLLKALYADRAASFASLYNMGITAELFPGDERTLFNYIERFYLDYGSLPSVETVVANTGIALDWSNLPEEPLPYWADKVRDRRLLANAAQHCDRLRAVLANGRIEEVRETISHAYIAMEEGRALHSIKLLTEVASDVVSDHNRIQQHTDLPGIPFAFPFFNLVSGGMMGGDLISIVGEPATAKSYFLLNDALHTHDSGYKTMFFSMEMPLLQCGRRIISLRSKVNYARLRLGRVSYFGMDRIQQEIESMSREIPFHLISGGIFGTIDKFYVQVKHYKPDIVFLDGAYLMRPAGGDNKGKAWEKATNVMENLKHIALAEDIPIVISYQFNRAAPGTLAGIAVTATVGQLSSIVLATEHEENDNSSNMRPIQYKIIKVLKGREGETGKIRVELDFGAMIFKQDEVIAGMADDFEYETMEEQREPNTEDDEPFVQI